MSTETLRPLYTSRFVKGLSRVTLRLDEPFCVMSVLAASPPKTGSCTVEPLSRGRLLKSPTALSPVLSFLSDRCSLS